MTISRNLSALGQYVSSTGTINQTATLPSQSGNATKLLLSDGSTASWGTINASYLRTRILSLASNGTVSVNADSYDAAEMINTQAAGTLLISAPTGTAVNGQKLLYKIQCTYAQTLNWASIFQGSTDLVLPGTTSGNTKWDFYGFMYNSTPAKWQLVAKMAGF